VTASASRPPGRIAAFARSAEQWSNEHPAFLFVALTAWYVALIWHLIRRPLWFDELSTFYIAQQPTVSRMMEAIRTVDLNPPLSYFLTRWSMAAFGASPWGARLPGAIAFWGGSVAIFALLRRRASSLIAALGVLLFWCTPYFPYAAEARPYGLLLGLSAILLAGWDTAAFGRRKLGLTTVFVAAILLLLSHLFGTLSLGAVWVGEAVRSWRRRKLDLPMLAVLLLPLLATITYRPIFHTFQTGVFPPESQASWNKLYFLYFAVFRWMSRPLLAIGLIALFTWRRRQRVFREMIERKPYRQETRYVTTPPYLEGTFALPMCVTLTLLFLVPLGLTILFMRSHGAFFDRYGMVAVLPIVLLVPLLLARRWTRFSASASFGAFCCVAFLLLLSTALRAPLTVAASTILPPHAANKATRYLATSPYGPFRPWWKALAVPEPLLQERAQAPLIPSLDAFHPDLPLVAGNELTFVEMDNHESDVLTHRLFYLYDRQAEVAIAHRSAANSILKMKNFFPLRGTIAPYASFVSKHRRFLVLALYEHSGDWLLRKLEADGATLQIIGRADGYADTDLYLVTYPTPAPDK
jgi:hypothetical protein